MAVQKTRRTAAVSTERSGDGRQDDVVPLSQSESYVEAARAAGARAELLVVDGDHFTVVDPGSDVWERTVAVLGSPLVSG